MNIETTSLQGSASINNYSSTKNSNSTENSDTSFKQELDELKESQEKEVHEIESSEKEEASQESNNSNDIKDAIDGLEDVVEEVNKNKNNTQEKDLILINNDMNIPDGFKQKFEAGMNFNSNEQNFSEFMQNNKSEQTLALNVNDLKEESEILSTMAENIAIANKLNINKKNSIELESNINFDSIIMNKSDVDIFVNLVNNQEITLESLKESPKSAQASKTLLDLLTKAMNENKPVRIDFDNDISIIIRISRDGKISADFLPSSQVAEAYLKENLPLLKQRFDEENIEYNELNQRKQEHRQKDKDENKKGRDNE